MDTGLLIDTLNYFVRTTTRMILTFVGVQFVVGIFKECVSESDIRRLLTGKRLGLGNVIGAGFGSLTPFCSCGGIPIFVGILNSGAPFGSAISFLLASPLISPVIVGLLAAVFGWRVTGIYVTTTFALAVVLGGVYDKLGLEKYVKRVRVVGERSEEQKKTDIGSRAIRILIGVWVQIKSLWLHLLIGVAIGALVRAFFPAEWIAGIAGKQNPLAIPIAAAIGGPFYIRASAAIPICSSLLEKGMGLGAVMALLVGSAGTSIPSLAIMSGIFKPRLLTIFVVTILGIATFAGYVFHIYNLVYLR